MNFADQTSDDTIECALDEIEMYKPSRKWWRQGMLLLKEFATIRPEGFNSNDFVRWAEFFDDFNAQPAPHAFQALLRMGQHSKVIKVQNVKRKKYVTDEADRTVWVAA